MAGPDRSQGPSPVQIVLIMDAVLFGVLPLLGVVWLIVVANVDVVMPKLLWSTYYSWYAAAEPVLGFLALCGIPLWLVTYGGSLATAYLAFRRSPSARILLMIAVIWFNMMHIAGLRFRAQYETVDGMSAAPDETTLIVRIVFALFLIALNALVLFGPIGNSYFGGRPADVVAQENAS